MNSMKSENVLAMAKALMNHGGWLQPLEIAELAGVPSEVAYRSWPHLQSTSMGWKGCEVLDVRLAQSIRQAGRMVKEYRILVVKKDASPRDLILKYHTRNPWMTLHELAVIANVGISQAHKIRKSIIETGAGVQRPRPDRPRKKPKEVAATAHQASEMRQYGQAKQFRAIWPSGSVNELS